MYEHLFLNTNLLCATIKKPSVACQFFLYALPIALSLLGLSSLGVFNCGLLPLKFSFQGLVVPVIRNADGMNFAQIEKEINTLAKKANDGTISIDEMAGGSFTISNGGVYGSLLSTPIINPPQVRSSLIRLFHPVFVIFGSLFGNMHEYFLQCWMHVLGFKS